MSHRLHWTLATNSLPPKPPKSFRSKSASTRSGSVLYFSRFHVGLSEKMRAVLEFSNHSEFFHLPSETLSYSSAVWMTERLCSRKSTGKSECLEKCQEYCLSSWNFSTRLWCSTVSSFTALRFRSQISGALALFQPD